LARIIGGLLLAAGMALGLGACSTLQLAYNNLPEFGYWWLDGYLDFDGSQTPRVRDELTRLLAWHRRQELPQLVALLRRAEALAPQDVTPAQACELVDALRDRLLALAEEAEPAGAELAVSLTPAQLGQLRRKYDKVNAEYRSDWLALSPRARHEKRYERWLERSEDFYGTLDAQQRNFLARSAAQSIFSPALLDAERRRRQDVALTTLRSLAGAQTAEAQRAIHAYVQSIADPPPGPWRSHQQALQREGCRDFATLHNMTRPDQREQALKRLRRYEADLNALGAQ